jgi:hypothetical protein
MAKTKSTNGDEERKADGDVRAQVLADIEEVAAPHESGPLGDENPDDWLIVTLPQGLPQGPVKAIERPQNNALLTLFFRGHLVFEPYAKVTREDLWARLTFVAAGRSLPQRSIIFGMVRRMPGVVEIWMRTKTRPAVRGFQGVRLRDLKGKQ